jgi:MPBQ/MSBQ methyltransferase
LLIDGFRQDHAGRDVHLGYWDDPPALSVPCGVEEFATAQRRLTEILVGLSGSRGGQSVLDVGCGFGGTLDVLARTRSIRLTGVNIDPRQLEICRSISRDRSELWLVLADACSLPFEAASFDTIFCVEAMFHFSARRLFLSEAARVVRTGGRMVLSDILLRDPGGDAPWPSGTIERVMRQEYGPWPQLWLTADEIMTMASDASFEALDFIDATKQTLPTYRITAPKIDSQRPNQPSAGTVMRWLHERGYLTYVCTSFIRK